MKQRQRGMTFLGMVTILVILGAALYAGIRLVPVFLEYTKVARALEQVRDEHSAIETNAQMIRNSLERRWDVEDINSIGWKEVEIKKTNEGFDVTAVYQVEQPFIANVYLLAKIDKTVVIQQ
jgi:type II secretory pathway pseudopilin PulG